MAKVKTFRIHPDHGVPDKEIREFLDKCELEELINVNTTFIPPVGKYDARLTVIVTKLDDFHMGELDDANRSADTRRI